MVHITQFAGDPGAGKTTKMINDVINNAARYVYAGSRKELCTETHNRAVELGYSAISELVISDRSCGSSVKTRLENFIRDNDEADHALAVITHAGLMDATPDQFEGWNLLIDEVPSQAVMTGSLHARASLASIKLLFDLIPDPQGRPGIMQIVSRPADVHDILGDRYLKDLANLWKRARSTPVFIQAEPRQRADGSWDEWADIATKDCPYVSVWTFADLWQFQSITVAAAGLEHSLVHLCNPRPYNVVAIRRKPSKAQIRIHWFDAVARFSSHFFESPEGSHNLKLIAEHIGGRDERIGFWTCNSTIRDMMVEIMPGGYVSPKQEGINRLNTKTSCAAFYSAKKSKSDDNLMCSVYGITPEQIEAAREWEHLNQFVMRGAPRCEDFAGRYDVYVYSKAQAERLASYMIGIGFADTLTAKIELDGIKAKPPSKKPGRKPMQSIEQKAEKKKARNAAAYLARKAKTAAVKDMAA